MVEPYAPYQLSGSFQINNASTFQSSGLHDELPAGESSESKRHAACDECRKRKLKCTGEPSGCSRCIKNGLPCHYSQQKQMGRPRKKQRTDEDYARPSSPITPLQPQRNLHGQADEQSITVAPESTQQETPIDPSLSAIDRDLTNFQNICSAPMAQTIRNQKANAADQTTILQSYPDFETHLSDRTTAPAPSLELRYPLDIAQWPDFSSVETLPTPLLDKFPTRGNLSTTADDPSSSSQYPYDPDADQSALSSLSAAPGCPCLPNLYLALSTLSTVSSFPTSPQTIETLLAAHRTARSVIYCHVCPLKFQTGSQNLMLGTTLLTIAADHWHRIRKATTEDLKRGFSTDAPSTVTANQTVTDPSTTFITAKEGQGWRQFSHDLIRAYVFGDQPIPTAPSSLSFPAQQQRNQTKFVAENETLFFLVNALMRRQRQWHGLEEATDEFPDRPPTDLVEGYFRRNRPRSHSPEGDDDDDDRDLRRTSRGEKHCDASSSRQEKDERGKNSGGAPVTHGHKSKGHDHGHLCLMLISQPLNIVKALDSMR